MEKGLLHGKHLATGLPVLLRSRANALLSVRRVTEINAGRKTAGIDGRVVLAGWEKADMASWLTAGAPGSVPGASCSIGPSRHSPSTKFS